MLNEADGECQEITVTYFRPDEKKEGGAYLVYSGLVTEIRDFERSMVFADGTELPLDFVVAIEGDLFDEFLCESGEWNDEKL